MKNKKLTAFLSAIAVTATMLIPMTITHAEERTITVGAGKDFTSIHAAIQSITENPASESDRITINVDPGDYEEQIIFDNRKYITLQQTPGTEGRVNLHWYYCTGYCASNADLNGNYNENIDWYTYPPKDSLNKTYQIGELIPKGTTLTYTDKKGETHTETVKNAQYLGSTGGMDKMAALIIRNNSENITIKDFNIVNSVPVFATQGEKDAHLTPAADYPHLPDRSALANCTEDTPEEPLTAAVASAKDGVTKTKYDEYIKTHTLTPGQSAWLARAGIFNERGHAVSFYSGDKITFENVRIRGNQDSLYAAGGRAYFKNCDVIGGTDYIYGGATIVFDHCRLGLEGFSDKSYGSPIATGGHDIGRKYGYLFYHCTLYNMRDNNGTNNFGGPWQAGSQITYFNCALDDNGTVGNSPFVLDPLGYHRFGAENGLSRSYEYGTANLSGKAVDLSRRIVNKPTAEGGPGMGTVLDKWQILEFNPRNYFSKECDARFTADWDPMNFQTAYLAQVDAEIEASTIDVPAGENTVVNLPVPSNDSIEFHWVSASSNAVVSSDEKTLSVIRPALGEAPIETSVILYARDKATGFGDKKIIPVTIAATTDTENVFDIPVTITQSVSASTANHYTVTVTRNGALIKEKVLTVAADTLRASDVIQNLPASSDGIDYDVKIVSQSDEFTIVDPEDGAVRVTGVTNIPIALAVSAQMLIDDKINLNMTASASGGMKSIDLISLAKQYGADAESITSSDVITVEYDLDIKANPVSTSYIDFTTVTPAASCNTNADINRLTLTKINNGWTQLDMVDNTQGFSGVSNIEEHQWLNITGKFDYTTINHVKMTVNYKTKTITAEGSGSGNSQSVRNYTFTGFPENAEKGSLYLGIYPSSTADNYTISNVNLTYKKLVEEIDPDAVFNIPIAVQTNYALDTDSFYTVTLSRNGQTTAEKIVPVPAGQTSGSATLENVPASIRCDVEITGSDSNMLITAPTDGKTTIFGIAGTSVPLAVEAKKLIADTINLGIDYSSVNGQKKYDLIALAKANGADDAILSSDSVTVTYTLNVTPSSSGNSFIDLLSSEPASALMQDGVSSRFILAKLGHWNQLDMVDSAQKYSGSSNGPDQWLNACGKFTEGTPSTVSVTIDYKNQKLSAAGSGSNKPAAYEFAAFPPQYEKGNLYMGIYSGGETFAVSDVKITYQKLADIPMPDPPVPPEPSTSATITSAYTENGNTVVTFAESTHGTIFAVTYEEGRMKNSKTAPVSGTSVTLTGIEADTVYVWNSADSMLPLCKPYSVTHSSKPITGEIFADFTAMNSVPLYSAANGQGFTEKSSAIMPNHSHRQVNPSAITISAEGAKITESSGAYLHKKNNSDDGEDYNNGGMIYRIDTGKAGAYHLEVEVTGTNSDTVIAPTGMDGSKLTGTSNWDNANMVARTVSAKWEGSKWTYDFATGEKYVEIEIEPKTLATAAAPQTVGVKSIKLTPLENNAADGNPTIHILGDSTQKTYTFNETISAWGQTLGNYFDKSKVNVINYSMGGRAMKSNYCEGRFDEILIRGKEGDFVFIHSAHNDETISTNRFSRGAGTKKDDLAVNNENYNKWLTMYTEAVKARGMTPVLVTAMPRVGSTGKYSESDTKPNGFNPDSPANMRAKAAADPQVGLAELYTGAKAYIDSLDGKEVAYIYNNIEAGETPANNSANGAKGDGTHYKEAAAKQWSRIILQSIYDQSVAVTDTYTDKAIMQKLVSLMPDSVVSAAQNGDWSAVFPEIASDVSAAGIVPNAKKQSESSYYYRNNIEKALQLGLLHKDSNNLFKPTETITVGEFARGVEKAFGLAENSLTSYTKTYAQLTAEGAVPASAEAAAVSTQNADNSALPLADTGEGAFTVTVTQPTGGTVTIYNESAFHTATTDIIAGTTANQQLADNEYFTLNAPMTVTNKSDKNGVFAENTAISANCIEIRNDGAKQPVYIAKANGTLTLYLMFVDHKLITCENKTDGTKAAKYINNTEIAGTTQANQYAAVTFDVKAGKTYEFYTNGGTGRLFGVKYESNDYPQSTASLTVNNGDEIRITAVPNENYVNGSILVNGNAVSNKKEYTFAVSGNTTVTASFTAEPALIETTRVASDAALTREVMGAILYDAYQLADKTIIAQYMKQNGGVPSPDDPNYDPNIQYEGSPYIPLTGWGALTDKNVLTPALYAKVKAAYNLGLIRSEKGIARGSIACGTELEPKTAVTRAKAAKALVFAFILTQPLNGESQTVPTGYGMAPVSDIVLPNASAQTIVFN